MELLKVRKKYEESKKNTDALAFAIFNETIDIEITQKDLDRTHRIDKNDKNNNRLRPAL